MKYIETPEQALKHLASNLKTRRDRVALDIIVDFMNRKINHDHFAKLFVYLFTNGLLTYRSSYEASQKITKILEHDLETMIDKVEEAYDDIQTLKTFDENLISTDFLNPGGEENIKVMHPKDKAKIKNGVDRDIINKKLTELINKALNV
jgi:hypothetical protein